MLGNVLLFNVLHVLPSEQLFSNFWHSFRNFLAVLASSFPAFYEHNRATPILGHLVRKFSGKVSRKSEKCWIFEKRTFQPKFWKFPLENKTERKFPVQRFRKFGYTSRGCLFSWNSAKNAVPFVTVNLQKFKADILIEWKAPLGTKCPYSWFVPVSKFWSS